MAGLTRGVAALGALIGAGGLVLQFVILHGTMSADGQSALAVLWRFFGFFTILTNVLIALIMGRAALKPDDRTGLNSPLLEVIGMAGILLVGAVYHTMLAQLWNPQGAQLIADLILHSATPIIFALFWLLRPHGALTYRDAALCIIWPLAYTAYALARGATDGWYAYAFLDPTQRTWAEIGVTAAAMSAAFFAGALALVLIDKMLTRRA